MCEHSRWRYAACNTKWRRITEPRISQLPTNPILAALSRMYRTCAALLAALAVPACGGAARGAGQTSIQPGASGQVGAQHHSASLLRQSLVITLLLRSGVRSGDLDVERQRNGQRRRALKPGSTGAFVRWSSAPRGTGSVTKMVGLGVGLVVTPGGADRANPIVAGCDHCKSFAVYQRVRLLEGVASGQ